MSYRTPKRRRAAHDLNHVMLALFLVALAGLYAAFVLDFFGPARVQAAPHTWAFVALMCAPSFALVALVGVVWHDWRAYRPRVRY